MKKQASRASRSFLLMACLGALGACHDSSGHTDGGTDASASSGPVLITEPEQGMTPIYTLMSSAKHKLDMTMYELDDPMATSLLMTAAKNGVTVRVILDQNLEMQGNAAAYAALSGLTNVTVHWANPIYASTHQKTITIDDTTSAIMTLNFSAEDYPTSRDFALITSDPADVAAIEATFEADLVNASITPSNGTDLVWSPTNSLAALTGIIGGAKTSLLVENEELSYDEIVEALAKAALRGVDVKLVMESSTAYAANFTALESVGVKVSTYRHSSLYIHAKIIVADYGSDAASAFLGSENFSLASLTENRELGIITSDAATVASLAATLTSDYEGGKPFGADAGTLHHDFATLNDASSDD